MDETSQKKCMLFLKELGLRFLKCLMVVGCGLQENDVKRGKEEMPQAHAEVINSSCITLCGFVYKRKFFNKLNLCCSGEACGVDVDADGGGTPRLQLPPR
jgi:hypothetical protein